MILLRLRSQAHRTLFMGKLADTFGQIVKTMKEGDEIFQLNIKEVEESVKAIAESENKLIKD